MGAKLIAPDGDVTELTPNQYLELRLKLIDLLPDKQARILALIDFIKEAKTPEDDLFWAEFDAFLASNRLDLTRNHSSLDTQE